MRCTFQTKRAFQLPLKTHWTLDPSCDLEWALIVEIFDPFHGPKLTYFLWWLHIRHAHAHLCVLTIWWPSKTLILFWNLLVLHSEFHMVFFFFLNVLIVCNYKPAFFFLGVSSWFNLIKCYRYIYIWLSIIVMDQWI